MLSFFLLRDHSEMKIDNLDVYYLILFRILLSVQDHVLVFELNKKRSHQFVFN